MIVNPSPLDLQKKCGVVPCIGIASGLGGSHSGSGEGPLLIHKNLPEYCWEAIILPDLSIENRLEQIAIMNQKLAETAFQSFKKHSSLMVVGGDHSCGIGTWSGVSEAKHQAGEELALLWFDAHMDSHTFETSESGNPHGMPLAALLGYGSSKFTKILSDRPKIKPENLFLIGIRSFEPAEKILLEKLNVRVYYIEEVIERGLKAILIEILGNLSSRHIPYGISLDIDFFDPSIMSATGTPEKMGPPPEEFIENYSLFESYPPVAFEFVEFNPPLDREGQSLHYVKKILKIMHNLFSS
jgi:arginase